MERGEIHEAIELMSTPGRGEKIREIFLNSKRHPFQEAVFASSIGDIQDTIDLLGVCDDVSEGAKALVLSAVYSTRAKKLRRLESSYIRTGLHILAIKTLARSDVYTDMSNQFKLVARSYFIAPEEIKKGFKKSRT